MQERKTTVRSFPLSQMLKAFIVAGLISMASGIRFAHAEGGFESVVFKENKFGAAVEWYCNAGKCQGDDGREYRCGYVICGGEITSCGCTCVNVSNASYPKGFCGEVSPFRTFDRANGPFRQMAPFPFALYQPR